MGWVGFGADSDSCGRNSGWPERHSQREVHDLDGWRLPVGSVQETVYDGSSSGVSDVSRSWCIGWRGGKGNNNRWHISIDNEWFINVDWGRRTNKSILRKSFSIRHYCSELHFMWYWSYCKISLSETIQVQIARYWKQRRSQDNSRQFKYVFIRCRW